MKDKLDMKYVDTESSCSAKEFESLIEKNKMEFPHNQFFNFLIAKKRKNKPIEITGTKNFPTYFFITFILIVSILTFKFVPNFVGFANKNNKIEDFTSHRHSLKYFSDYFRELDILSKIILLISQVLLLTISLSLNSIFIKKSNGIFYNKLFYYSTNICSFISTMSLVILSFYSDVTKIFSNHCHLVDDVAFLIFIHSTLWLAILLFRQIKGINSNFSEFGGVEIINDKISIFKQKKFYFILLMIFETFLYSLALLFLSYYNTIESYEKFAQFILILCINVASIMFLITWALFIFNLNNDFSDVLISLEYNKSNEYYIDLDDDNKNVL